MNNQTWKVGNRNLNAGQIRAYRDGTFDPKTMKHIDTKEEVEALRDVEKDVEVSTQPDAVETPEKAAAEDTEAQENPLVSELEENQKLRARFDELKAIGYVKLKKEGKDEYKKIKKELEL